MLMEQTLFCRQYKSIADASAGAAPTSSEAHESWYGISLVNSPGENSYPISTFTYLLVYENLNNVTSDPDTAQAMIHLIHWMITDGQKYNESLEYVPIAPEVKQIGIDGLKRIQFNGQPAWIESDAPSYVQPVVVEQPSTPEESAPQTYEQPVVQQTNNQSLSSEMIKDFLHNCSNCLDSHCSHSSNNPDNCQHVSSCINQETNKKLIFKVKLIIHHYP